MLKLDQQTHTATLAAQYGHGSSFDAEYMGSLEPLPGGNEFVGWGSANYLSEFSSSGEMLLDGVLPYPDISYRAEVAPWVGMPTYPPAGAARTHRGKTTVYASWNGATQVASWRVLAGNATSRPPPSRGSKPRSRSDDRPPVAEAAGARRGRPRARNLAAVPAA